MENQKILLAEDDKFIARAYKDGLEREGFVVVTALNGEIALKQIQEEKPNLILLDLILPVKDGFTVLEELKTNAKTKQIPVLILTNLSQESDMTKTKQLGAADYLVKSNLSLRQIVDRVKFHLAKTHALGQNNST